MQPAVAEEWTEASMEVKTKPFPLLSGKAQLQQHLSGQTTDEHFCGFIIFPPWTWPASLEKRKPVLPITPGYSHRQTRETEREGKQ